MDAGSLFGDRLEEGGTYKNPSIETNRVKTEKVHFETQDSQFILWKFWFTVSSNSFTCFYNKPRVGHQESSSPLGANKRS